MGAGFGEDPRRGNLFPCSCAVARTVPPDAAMLPWGDEATTNEVMKFSQVLWTADQRFRKPFRSRPRHVTPSSLIIRHHIHSFDIVGLSSIFSCILW